MKQYALFAGTVDAASGGWSDFVGAYPTQVLAERTGKRMAREERGEDLWWHVVDLATGQIVEADDEIQVNDYVPDSIKAERDRYEEDRDRWRDGEPN